MQQIFRLSLDFIFSYASNLIYILSLPILFALNELNSSYQINFYCLCKFLLTQPYITFSMSYWQNQTTYSTWTQLNQLMLHLKELRLQISFIGFTSLITFDEISGWRVGSISSLLRNKFSVTQSLDPNLNQSYYTIIPTTALLKWDSHSRHPHHHPTDT